MINFNTDLTVPISTYKDLIEQILFHKTTHSSTPYFYSYESGFSKISLSTDELKDLIKSFNLKPTFERTTHFTKSYFYKSECGNEDFLTLHIQENASERGNSCAAISAVFFDESKLDTIIRTFKEKRVFAEKKGEVYVLINGADGIEPFMIGDDYCELIRENYTDEVLKAYDRTIDSFNKEEPDGFISIFSGIPGSGKSYMLRAILGNVSNARFLYIPADLIASASGPALIKVLQEMSGYMPHRDVMQSELSNSDELEKNAKLILILEDADAVLAPRNQTDVGGISSLLNLTDGILGRLLNIRVVATTNSKASELDRAITRPGRLCVHVSINQLPPNQAQDVYKRLGGEVEIPHLHYTLAELYDFVNHPENIARIKRGKIGF